MVQIIQSSSAPSRVETEAPISSFKHKTTKHRSLRRAHNALSSSTSKKKEIVTSLAKKNSVRIHLNKPKKSGWKPITSNDEEKEWIVSFIFVLHVTRFFIRNAFIIIRQKMIYWFVNLNFNLIFHPRPGFGGKRSKLINSEFSFCT